MNADTAPLAAAPGAGSAAGSAGLPRVSASPRRGLQALIRLSFFGTSAVISIISALVVWWFPEGMPAPQQRLQGGLFLGLAVCSLLALRLPRRQVPVGMAGLLALATLVVGFTAWRTGWGLSTPGMSFLGLFVCILCVAASRRLGIALAVLAVACVLAADLALRFLGGPPSTSPLPSGGLRLITLLMLIGAGLACGLMLSHVMARFMRAADEREQRFSGLLSIAADAYWEVDEHWRLLSGNNQRNPLISLTTDDGIGQVPWELPQFDCDPDTLDTLRADLESRLPFRNLPVRWHDTQSGERHFMISGEPRFDSRGVFSGFWGVARDVTRDVAAQQALQATETRYQELFTRIPSPLVLHRAGRVLDANPAGLRLFGYDELEGMVGRDILAGYESGDSRERARRRAEELEEMAVGQALPVADFRLQGRDGRRLLVRATGVRVAAADGPATLSIFVDDTERRDAEDAVRRSEALLSHLVATSPDVITLTDLSTGRYAMVNRTFERLTGYGAHEVVGRTSVELGLWAGTGTREQFVDAVRQRGSVEDMQASFITKNGQRVLMQVSGARFAMDRRDYLVINGRDIGESERARLEREAILDNASVGIAVTRDRCFAITNPRFDQMFGWPRGGLLGQSGGAVWVSEQDYADVGQQFGAALARGENVHIERPALRRDGSTFLASITGKAIDPSHPAHGGTIWIVEDVTERRQFEQALARARDAAEAASRAKSAFLANTSHELRTPLNGILNLAQLARAADIEDTRRRQYLDQIAESSQSLADIISDILDLSKIEAGKLLLETTTFHLGELLRGVQRAYATLASGRTLDLQLTLEPGVDGLVLGDALRVRQILGNYLSNAIKFTPAGVVRLVARRIGGDLVRFEVHDTGNGIDADTRARLFQPFTQADESTTRRYGGTGLGLSICRELSVLMNGEVGVTSELGRGSQFWAELPLPAARPAAAPAAAVEPGAPTADLSGAHVLMVEDNAVNMMIAVAMLESWGLVVEQTTNGQEAVEAVARADAEGRRFDAVLMDVQMPVMSGYEATRALRATGPGQAVPIIALTAAALVTERQQALEAGMDDFLTKPIDGAKLRSTLARWLQSGRSTA